MGKFYACSDFGETLFLLRRLAADGHDVQLHVRAPAGKNVGKGIVPRAISPVPADGWTVLFDVVGRGAMGSAFRRRGLPVIGGNPFDVDLEVDRQRGTQLMQQVGIRVPETHAFRDFATARAFLATRSGTWFFKPSGNMDCALTHHGEAKELARWIGWAEKRLRTERGFKGFELQRQVKGQEVSVEGWFDGEQWVPPFNATLEEKHLLPGNLGPRTGCQSNVVWVLDDDAVLPEKTVKRMTALLREHHYVGPLDLNMIVSEEDGEPYGLEWSARTGFDALQALSLLFEGDMGRQLEDFAEGRLRRWDLRSDLKALTLRVTTPPFPNGEADDEVGLPLDPSLLRDPREILVDDVMTDRDGEPVLAGRDGAVCCVGAVGMDFKALQLKVLKRAAALKIPEKQYRLDPVERAPQVWAALYDAGLTRKAAAPTKRADAESRAAKQPDQPAQNPPHAPFVTTEGGAIS